MMIRNTYGHKSWNFPGGIIDKKETATEAVRREVIEEVGIKIENLNRIGQFKSISEYKRETVQVFIAKSKTRDFHIDYKEILEARWFDPFQLPKISDYAEKVIFIWNSKQY